MTSWWERHVLPHLTEKTLDNREVRRWRGRVCAGLSGRVLEVGFGYGLNDDHYPPAVTEVAAVEPSDLAWRKAGKRLAVAGARVERSGLDGQRLAEPDGSYDAVLTTFTLCTVPDPGAALREARRVLRPGGSLHFLEHGLAPDPGVQRWQRRLEPVQRRVAGGCHLTRRPVDLIRDAGFDVVELTEEYLAGPRVNRPFAFLSCGRALKSA